jgi:hypothetical protein
LSSWSSDLVNPHLGYFWGTAYWEAGILRSALAALDEAPQSRHSNPLHHRVALRFLVLKMLLLPAALVGTALLVAPGLYCLARLGPALLFVVQGRAGPGAALGLSNQVTRGRRGQLMLIVTVPMSVLMCAHVFRALSR